MSKKPQDTKAKPAETEKPKAPAPAPTQETNNNNLTIQTNKEATTVKKAGKDKSGHLWTEREWLLKDAIDNKKREHKIYFKEMEDKECAFIAVGTAQKIIKGIDVLKEHTVARDLRIFDAIPASFEAVTIDCYKLHY